MLQDWILTYILLRLRLGLMGKSEFAGDELKGTKNGSATPTAKEENQVYEMMTDWIPASDKFNHRPRNFNA